MKKQKKTKRAKSGRKNALNRTVRPAPSFSSALFNAVMSDAVRSEKPTGNDFDQLMRYVIYKESPNHPAYKENPLSFEEVRLIRKNCEENPEWAKVLADLRHEYNRLLETLEQSSFSHISEPVPARPPAFKRRFQLFPPLLFTQYRIPRLAVIFAVTLAVGFGLLAGISSLVTPRYFNATTITPVTFTTRGEYTVLEPGIDALYKQDYHTALAFFRHVINKNPQSDKALFALYFSGSIDLINARRTFFGLFPSFADVQVDSGIAAFTYVLSSIPTTGQFTPLEEQCRFMLGQAWLMKKNIPNARQEFERVIQLHGIKKQESEKILSILPLQ